jgi:hypothetical protein
MAFAFFVRSSLHRSLLPDRITCSPPVNRRNGRERVRLVNRLRCAISNGEFPWNRNLVTLSAMDQLGPSNTQRILQILNPAVQASNFITHPDKFPLYQTINHLFKPLLLLRQRLYKLVRLLQLLSQPVLQLFRVIEIIVKNSKRCQKCCLFTGIARMV